MFTLGNKEVIVNVATQFPFTPATATTGAVLNIKGLGTFTPTTVTSASARRASTAQLEKMKITIPTATELGIATTAVNVPVVLRVKVYTLRQASETAIDFVKRGRPLILEILVQGNTDGSAIATLIGTALTEYASKYPVAVFPFTAVISTNTVTLTATEGFYSFGEDVTINVSRNILPYSPTVTKKFATGLTSAEGGGGGGDTTCALSGITNLAVGDTIQFAASSTVDRVITEIVSIGSTITFTPALSAAGDIVIGQAVTKTQKAVEAVNDGKYLEESVRMSTTFTSDTYAINPQQVPIIGASYAQVTWTCSVPTTEGGWEAHSTPGVVASLITPQTFTMYFNEATCVAGATSLTTYLCTWLDAALVANGTGTTFTWMKKANGASAVSIASFVA